MRSPKVKDWFRPSAVRVAVFDGQFFDAKVGKAIRGEKFRAQTMWGWIAWSLAGKKGYEQSRPRTKPTSLLVRTKSSPSWAMEPNLILLDEILEYLIIRRWNRGQSDQPARRDPQLYQASDRSCWQRSTVPTVFSLPSSDPRQTIGEVFGGSVYNSYLLTAANSCISGSTAVYGGGIYNAASLAYQCDHR